jgi:hypothetical protein
VKKPILYILLTLYIAAQLRPLTAVVQDFIAHTFFKMEHMSSIHYENGHYHLHTELKNINEEDNNKTQGKVPTSQKVDESISANTLQMFNFQFQDNINASLNWARTQQDVISGHTQIDSPPPKA